MDTAVYTNWKEKGENHGGLELQNGFVYDLVEDKQVQKYKTLGYYETKQKAFQALAAYNENPYDLDADKITFAEC